jgi:ABC-2 type transport system permease protein
MHDDHPILYEIYNANPVTQAVLLFQRLFWYPLMDEADQKGAVHFPPDMYTRGAITLVLCLLLLWLAQKFFSRMENKFPERL